jgi:PKD repeat protein
MCSDTLEAGNEVTFNGSESYIKDFNIVNYFWDFGDGSHLQGGSVKHTFLLPGIYQVKLGITGEQNASVGPGKINCVTRQIVVTSSEN